LGASRAPFIFLCRQRERKRSERNAKALGKLRRIVSRRVRSFDHLRKRRETKFPSFLFLFPLSFVSEGEIAYKGEREGVKKCVFCGWEKEWTDFGRASRKNIIRYFQRYKEALGETLGAPMGQRDRKKGRPFQTTPDNFMLWRRRRCSPFPNIDRIQHED